MVPEKVVTLTMNPAVDVSANVALLEPSVKLRCSGERRDPGGGGINVARVLKRFGLEVDAIFPAGGAVGQALERLVEQEGVMPNLIPISGETREDFTVREEKSANQFRFVLPGPTLDEAECNACLEAFAASVRSAAFAVASGSLPPGVPNGFYGQIARLGKETAAKLAVDTSGTALAGALKEGVYLVKPSLRELSTLLHAPLESPGEQLAASRGLVTNGSAAMVALSLGGAGALLVTETQAWRAHAPRITPISSVGAGDSFLAAMVWRLVLGDEPREALRYAVAAGSAALLAPGTELSLTQDVNRLVREVVVEPV